MEIESALVAHPRVAEAAVVGRPHDIKGESVFAFVVLRGARPTGDTSALARELRDWVGEQLGAIAKPDDIRFADNLPKTRSGKIMRRLLRAIARGEEITQDISTLENPAIVEQLRGGGTAAKAPVAATARRAAAKAKAAAQAKPRKPAQAKGRKPVKARGAKRPQAPKRKPAQRKAARTRTAPQRKATKARQAPRRAAPRRKR